LSRSQRVPITTVSLKDRIAALGLQDRTITQPTPSSQSTTPLSTTASGFASTSPGSSTSVRVKDKAAQFEAIGGTPVPRGSFGLGVPPIVAKLKKTGELYGNRIPGSQPPLGRQWPPGSPGSAYGFDIEGASPSLRSVSLPLRTTSLTGSDDGIIADERITFEVNAGGKVDSSTGPVARIEVVPPTPAFQPPELSRRISVDPPFSKPVVEESTESLPRGDPALVPVNPKTPASDSVLNSNPTRSPSIHSHISSALASVEEEPAALDDVSERALPSPEQPTLTYTPEQLPQSITPHSALPKRKKSKPAPSPEASLSPPLRSPPLRRSISARGRDRNVSIGSTSGENGSVFTAPPVQGDDVSGGIYLSSTMETVERDGLGLDLNTDGDGSDSEEDCVRRDEVPLDAEATGEVVEQSSIGRSLKNDVQELVEELKRNNGSIIEDTVLKEPDDHSQGHERSTSSGTTDYTMADSPSSATSPDIERPQSTIPQLADDPQPDIGGLDETVHPDDLQIHDGLPGAAKDITAERASPRAQSECAESTPREAVEATKAPELNQPMQDKEEDPSQGSVPSELAARDKQDATSPVSPDSSHPSLSLPYKESISRAGLSDTGTASPARVLRELKQLGMEKRSSIALGPTRRASVLSIVLPTSPERLVGLFTESRGIYLKFVFVAAVF
jgi:hypothetical protein